MFYRGKNSFLMMFFYEYLGVAADDYRIPRKASI
jgi:hypothetical protein